ncbi:hypothetical protein O9992_26285 [Vibrio lentus]|nr:hypothetical protein [Vibrio lentus]
MFREGMGPLMAGVERIPPAVSYRGAFPSMTLFRFAGKTQAVKVRPHVMCTMPITKST